MIWRYTRFVCSILYVAVGQLVEAKDCPSTWHNYNGFCYMNTKDKMTIDEGEHFCSYFLESSVLEVEDYGENTFVTNFTSEKSWLGFRRCNNQRFFWTDSEPATFTAWDTSSGQPDNKDTNEQCVSMSAGGNWSDGICFEKKAFVCQEINKKCSDVKECFILKQHLVNWREARSKCQSEGRRLAKISSSIENKALASLLNGVASHVWIGLERRDAFCLNNSTRTTFHVWDFHEPNDEHLVENCMAIGAHGKWSDEQCNASLSVICKKDVDECLNKVAHGCDENSVCINTPGSFSCATCKDGYSRDGNSCSRKNTPAIILGALFGFSCLVIFFLIMYILRKSRRWVW